MAFDGRSLLPFLAGQTPDAWRDHVFMELEFGKPGSPTVVERRLGLRQLEANAEILRETRWKYVHFNGGLPPLLFDLESDPAETRNLAGHPRYEKELLRLSRVMLDHRMTHQFKEHTATLIGETGLVTLWFRSPNSFRQPFVRRPRDFYHLTTNAAVVGYRTH